MSEAPPVPPEEFRALIGIPDRDEFLAPPNPDLLAPATARRVLDLGCGCGRLARWFLTLDPRPERYLGLDIHKQMIDWDAENLVAPGFEFVHQDVLSLRLNPDGAHQVVPFPDGGDDFTLIIAASVFTHLVEDQTVFYLDEVARVLGPDGVLFSTWFLFEKDDFPMMQDFQNALYINPVDPTNAVIFDQTWLLDQLAARGLAIAKAVPPAIKGFQWELWIRQGGAHVDLPSDLAPVGRKPPPL
ncbi:MAG TPA: class I SAM-dependent methyltransferase [Acidimicrobiales bacterium]|nr:class I SAM-dependent methyltransferase [Acidimicrobiales bacterium]